MTVTADDPTTAATRAVLDRYEHELYEARDLSLTPSCSPTRCTGTTPAGRSRR